MNSSYQALSNICDVLEMLCSRVERRERDSIGTDQYMNSRMRRALDAVQSPLSDYLEFHTQYQAPDGRIGDTFREEFLDQWVKAYEVARVLYTLINNTLSRTSTAPGSHRRLSPLFQLTVACERQDLEYIHTALLKVLHDDTEQIKQMRRPSEVILSLRQTNNMQFVLTAH